MTNIRYWWDEVHNGPVKNFPSSCGVTASLKTLILLLIMLLARRQRSAALAASASGVPAWAGAQCQHLTASAQAGLESA